MVRVLSITSLALAAVSAVSALVVFPRGPPAGWRSDLLEDYGVYHTRYLELRCQNQHGKAFFDRCCHPLLAGEKPSSRPQCIPAPSSTFSASHSEPTFSTPIPEDPSPNDGCDDGDDHGSSVPPPTTTLHPITSTFISTYVAPTSKSGGLQVPPASSAPVQMTSTTSTEQPKPSSSSHAHVTTPEVTPSAPSPSPTSTGGIEFFTGGQATFFFQGGVAGACGKVHSDNDFIAAIDEKRYGFSGAVSSLCGKRVKITNTENGKTVIVTIADDCPTCKNANSIDLSVAAFKAIAPLSAGIAPISWSFI